MSLLTAFNIQRLLQGHPHIVHFIEASATALPVGGYEIFILMEFCSGGGIIDLANRRLRDRLREREILKIFGDVCEGLAVMHHLDPPLMHRDLKIENVLIRPPPSDDPKLGPTYKLADFGSASPVLSRHAPKSVEEIKRVEQDLNRSTTLQYRAPEMVDVYQRRVIDEKADIWAMGVFLYKLCYYITPFEENGGGPVAILHAHYRFPPSPPYSQSLKSLIASMLTVKSSDRPTIDQLIERTYELRGLTPPRTAKHYIQCALKGKQVKSLPVPASKESTAFRPESVSPTSDKYERGQNSSQQASHSDQVSKISGRFQGAGVQQLIEVDNDIADGEDFQTFSENSFLHQDRSTNPSIHSPGSASPTRHMSSVAMPTPDRNGPSYLHSGSFPATEQAEPNMRETRSQVTIRSNPSSLSLPLTNAEHPGEWIDAPAQRKSPAPSNSAAGETSSTLVSDTFLDEAPSRFASFEQLEGKTSSSTPPTVSSISSKAKQFEQMSGSNPSYSGQILTYQPRKRASHVPRQSSVMDRWPPAAKSELSAVKTKSKEEAICSARSRLSAEPAQPAPSLPPRSGSVNLPPHTEAGLPHSSQDAQAESPAPVPAHAHASAQPLSNQVATSIAAEFPPPSQDWLTGPDDLLTSPVRADETSESASKPKPGRLSQVWPDPAIVKAGPPKSPATAPSPPSRRSPLATALSVNAERIENVQADLSCRKDMAGVPGKVKPPPWILEQSKFERQSSSPVAPSTKSAEHRSGTLGRNDVIGVVVQPEDAMDLALIEGEKPSEACEQSKTTEAAESGQPNAAEASDHADRQPVPAPSWDAPENESAVEMDRLAAPLTPSSRPSPSLPSPKPNLLTPSSGSGASVPQVFLSPTSTAAGSLSEGGALTGFSRNRLSQLIKAANERDTARGANSSGPSAGSYHGTRSRSTGLIPNKAKVASEDSESVTAISLPPNLDETPKVMRDEPSPVQPPSLSARIRQLEISKSESAAKCSSIATPTSSYPVRSRTLPQTSEHIGMSEQPELIAPPLVRPKPKIAAKPSNLKPFRTGSSGSSKPPPTPTAPKPSPKPRQRDAAELQGHHFDDARTGPGLLNEERRKNDFPDPTPDSASINSLISK